MMDYKRKGIILVLLNIIFLNLMPLSTTLRAQTAEDPLRDPDRMYGFAQSLYKEEEYYRSITELLRFTMLYPDHPKTKEAQYLIGMCYQKGKRWQEALLQFRNLAISYPQEDLGQEAFFQIGMTTFLSGHYQKAVDVFTAFIERYPLSTKVGNARYQIGIAQIHLGDLPSASKALKSVKRSSSFFTISDRLAQGIKEIDQDVPQKSPLLAGTLSALLPGAGHLYSEKTREGVASFLLNGAFIVGTYTTIQKGYFVLGGILGFLELGFYSGGIYTAFQGAKAFNERSRQGRIQRFLEDHKVSLHPFGVDRGTGLAFQMRF